MAATVTAPCFNHRKKPGVATCGTCGHALCTDCIVHTPVGVKCRTCTGVKAAAGVSAGGHVVAGRSAQPARASAGHGRRPPWAIALVAAGVVVLAVAGYSLANRGGGSKQAAQERVVAPLGSTIAERTVDFVGAGGLHLGGTFTLPPATPGQATVPAVLLVPGLGAIDRNSVTSAGGPDALRDAVAASLSVSALGTSEPLFHDLAQTLAQNGIASFRYDKRGTADSKLAANQKLSFDDEVTDAKAALDFLTQRAEVGSGPVAVFGHDQGGMVAMRAAAGNPRVKALVLASLPGRPLAAVLADDLTRSRGAAVGDEFRTAVSSLTTTGKVPAAGSLSSFVQPLFPAGQEGYLMSIYSLDPAAEAKAVSAPTLVVRGDGDPSTTAAEATTLSSAIRSGAEVMVGVSGTDRNLALPDAGHVHSNAPTQKVSDQDADLAGRIAMWIGSKLHP